MLSFTCILSFTHRCIHVFRHTNPFTPKYKVANAEACTVSHILRLTHIHRLIHLCTRAYTHTLTHMLINTYGHTHMPTYAHTCSCTLIHSGNTPTQSGTGYIVSCTLIYSQMYAHTSTHSYTYSFTLHTCEHINIHNSCTLEHTHTKDPSYSLMGALNIKAFQVMMKKHPYPSLPVILLQSLPGVQVSASFTAQVLMVSTLPWTR